MKKPAVFFDRDGVLNVDRGYLYRIEEFEWLPGSKEAIKFCNDNGYYVFVVTNQSGIARGYYHEADVLALHKHMNQELAAIGAHIDAFYYCPHHETAEVEQYRMACACRKPEPGLLLQAMQEWEIDVERSLLLGDKERDVQAAEKSAVRGFLTQPEENLLEQLQRCMRKMGDNKN